MLLSKSDVETFLHSGGRCRSLPLLGVLLLACFIETAQAVQPPPPQPANIVPRNFSVEVSAVTQSSPPQITLSWPADSYATSYTVFRKSIQDAAWPASGVALGASSTEYVDTAVADKSAYEYKVVKDALDAAHSYAYTGYGFVYAGIRAPITESRGTLVLVVDLSQASALASEISRLIDDLNGDGWQVIRRDVSRSESVPNVKAVIAADYAADPQNVRCVFLLGHVPVAYSGLLNPDGHDAHLGAWPADGFYASMSGDWTDSTVDNALADRAENRNVPGDGKYDQSVYPAPLALQIGRVDLANMPSFNKSETDLLRQYLNKDHAFRHKGFSQPARGLIDDNFPDNDFAAEAWFSNAAFFGPGSSAAADWLTTLNTQSFRWAYGYGPGTYTSASGVGRTGELAAIDTHAVFTELFGSYFGDWDNTDNFLRAPLCSPTYTLTSVWGARPWWFFHHMALGETIGFSARLSQNNDGVLYPSSSRASVRNVRGVHMALMGDPTLRMHVVAPPSEVTSNIIFTGITVNWKASSETVEGYYVYRSSGKNQPFKRVSRLLVTGTTFQDSATAVGTYRYMVRAVKLETSGSGSYFNPSQGAFADVNRLEPGDVAPEVAITSPAPDATFLWPATIVVSATASDVDDTVARVDFYAAETLIGSATSAPYNITWTDAAPGSYVLAAVAVDTMGLETTSGEVRITVRAPITFGLNPIAMNVQHADAKLRFPSSLSKDALSLRAVIQLNDNFVAQGQRVEWEIGGVTGSATLDAKGRAAPSATVRVQLRFKPPKKGETFTARPATLSIALKNQSLSGLMLKNIADLNATTTSKGESAKMDIDVVLAGHQAYRAANVDGLYRAKKDKTGAWISKPK